MDISEADEILKLIDGLRERGCWSFEGLGLKLQIRGGDPFFNPEAGQKQGPIAQGPKSVLAPENIVALTEASHAAKAVLVDAGGGLMVDPDLLGHEG